MKKIIQPARKVYGITQQQQQNQQQTTSQMNAVRKINSLLQSGTVSVTSQSPRVLQKKTLSGNPIQTISSSVSITSSNSNFKLQQKCYVCGEGAGVNPTLLTEASTATSQTDFTSKIAKIVGEGFMVIVGTDDVVCRRCITLFNQLDKLEVDLEHVRTTLTNYIHKKYNIIDDEVSPPPIKMQKMGTNMGGGTTSTTYSIKTISNQTDSDSGDVMPRKISNASSTVNNTSKDVESQLTTMFDAPQQPQQPQQQQQQQTVTTTSTNNGATPATTATTTIRRNPIKMYKCMSCDFKTQDLTQFQPHYEQCKQSVQQGTTTTQSATQSTPNTTTTSTSAYRCKLCKKLYASIALLKQHNAQEHNNQTQIQTTEVKVVDANNQSSTTLYQCNMCQYRTPDKQNHDDHLRKHIKLKPFKCRVCLMRFETREQASVHAKTHQPDYFKCGMCNVTFNKRELLVQHLEVHDKSKKTVKPQQQQQTQQQTVPVANVVPTVQAAAANTQKTLQAAIDEALRDTIGEPIDAKQIQFHSCTICSLTFINEQLYSQHMKMHKTTENTTGTTTSSLGGTTRKQMNSMQSSNQGNGSMMSQNSKILSTNQLTSLSHNTMSDDLESIFEKIHSDKSDVNTAGDNLVITSQESTSGNITFNITIPQQDNLQTEQKIASAGIDMPTLDQNEEQQMLQHEIDQNQQKEQMNMAVSMPSLDDDGETQNSQVSNTENVPMDLDDLQNAGDGQQIKFILNENGQLLQLDNHILTTDADGNQIIVQGTDSEQIQQLLQSVGVMVQGEGLGDGETLQMISGENNQMILVQGADGQEQLIDASLLNADGNIVIQQSQEGELNAEGTHITTEDGLQIPVSFTTSGEVDQEGNLTVSMAGDDGSQSQQIHLQLQQSEHDGQQQMEEGEEMQQHVILQQEDQKDEDMDDSSDSQEGHTETATSGGGNDATELFNFDELIQPQVVVKKQHLK